MAGMTDHERREAAMRLALQLPPHRADALRVLDLLCAVTAAFLWEPEPEGQSLVRRVGAGEYAGFRGGPIMNRRGLLRLWLAASAIWLAGVGGWAWWAWYFDPTRGVGGWSSRIRRSERDEAASS
jgi:hypothetical protein